MVKLTRAQIRPGVKGVDVIVKSSKGFALSFAPSWRMVMGYKNGTLTETQYTEQYLKILDAVSVEVWRWLYAQAAEGGEVTLLCYCRDGQFCHTRLIMQCAVEKYPKAFGKSDCASAIAWVRNEPNFVQFCLDKFSLSSVVRTATRAHFCQSCDSSQRAFQNRV